MKITRLHSFLLGLPRPLPADADQAALIEVVHLLPPARRLLREALSSPGATQGGLLVGRIVENQLTVHHVIPGGYRWWVPREGPLSFDQRYVLGWLDALTTQTADLEWVGMWVAYPNSEVGPMYEDARQLWLGQQRGLLDEQSVLLSVGWQEGRLSARAYLPISTTETTLLEVVFSDPEH